MATLTFRNYDGTEPIMDKYSQAYFTWNVPYSVTIDSIIVNSSGALNSGGDVLFKLWINGWNFDRETWYNAWSIQDITITGPWSISAGSSINIQWTTLEGWRYMQMRYTPNEQLPVRISYRPTQSISFSQMQSRLGVPSGELKMSHYRRGHRFPRMSMSLVTSMPASTSNQSMSTMLMTPFTTRSVVFFSVLGVDPYYNIGNWPDSFAQWIWTDYNIDRKWFCFWKYIYLDQPQNVRVYLATDNFGTLFVDGTRYLFSSSYETAVNSSIIQLSAGMHLIEVNAAENIGTPTSFIMSMVNADYGFIITRSNTSWKCIDHTLSLEQNPPLRIGMGINDPDGQPWWWGGSQWDGAANIWEAIDMAKRNGALFMHYFTTNPWAPARVNWYNTFSGINGITASWSTVVEFAPGLVYS